MANLNFSFNILQPQLLGALNTSLALNGWDHGRPDKKTVISGTTKPEFQSNFQIDLIYVKHVLYPFQLHLHVYSMFL